MNIHGPQNLFQQPTPEDIALRLRQIRQAKGWSLADVEIASKGVIKAVVLGSYERCDRTLSIKRAIQLTTFFDVPFDHLFKSQENPKTVRENRSTERIILDLRALQSAPQEAEVFKNFTTWIIAQRCDWNGEVLSIRKIDLEMLALLNHSSSDEVRNHLLRERYLLQA